MIAVPQPAAHLGRRLALSRVAVLAALAMAMVAGCRSGAGPFVAGAAGHGQRTASGHGEVNTVTFQAADGPAEALPGPDGGGRGDGRGGPVPGASAADSPEEVPAPPGPSPAGRTRPAADEPSVDRVIVSVVDHFPLVRSAAAARGIASGEALSALGAFDHKLDGFSNIQPLDFYENHWYRLGVERATFWGGKIGWGYKLGRGSFEPWFLERETNDGGEWSAKVQAPIVRDRAIDQNRAELFQARIGRSRVEPLVRAAVIGAVRDGVAAYWDWVAAGAQLEVAQALLERGEVRAKIFEAEAEVGRKARFDVTDNRRIVVSRLDKRIDAERKLEQAASKLSLFFRAPSGVPAVPAGRPGLDRFPPAPPVDPDALAGDVDLALATRPELEDLTLERQQLQVALRQAINETLPDVDGGLLVAQDTGNPVASRTKSEFELEATMTLSVPLQRRKAIGKVRQVRGKLAQVAAKTQFVAEKVTIDVDVARAALIAAAQRVEQTTDGVRLANAILSDVQLSFEVGNVPLFELNIREEQAASAALAQVAALLDYHVALADYAAALGLGPGDLLGGALLGGGDGPAPLPPVAPGGDRPGGGR